MEQENSQNHQGHKPDLKILSALFPDQESVDKAYLAVTLRGYTKYEINIIMSETIRKKYISEIEKKTTPAAIKNTIKSSIRGAPFSAIMSIAALLGSSILLPGTKIHLVGPVTLGLAGAGVDGIAGGLLAMLWGLEISEKDALAYESGIKAGKIVFTVLPRNEVDREYLKKQFIDYQAQNIN